MSYFGCPITPPPKGSLARSSSVPSFLSSEYLISRVKVQVPFHIKMEDIKDLQMYPHFKNATTVSDYLERTDENMLVLLPAHEKLTKSITRYKKSTEDLKDSDAKFQQVLRRAEELEQLLLETKEVSL